MLHLYYRLRHHLLARGKLPGAATSVRVRIHEMGKKHSEPLDASRHAFMYRENSFGTAIGVRA
jgi:hypothetical protein